MKHTSFTSQWAGLHDSNQFLRVACLMLLATNLLMAIGLMTEDRTVVLVPQGLSGHAEIAKNKASEGYKKSWALYAAMLLGNVTPENADFVLDALGDMVTSEIKVLLGDQVRASLETLKAEQVSARFETKKITYEPETDKVFVTGKSWLSGVGAKSGQTEQTFEFIVDIHDYAPLITHMALYDGGARVQAVARQQQAKDQAKANNK